MRDIAYYERAGSTYIAFNASGRPVGIVVEVKRNIYPRDSGRGLKWYVDRQEG